MGKKLWITTGIIGALAAAYTAGGFLGVPYGVNWALKKYAEPIVGRTITTQEVKFNPFTLQFSVKGLNVQKDGEPPLLSVGYLQTKVLWNSLFKLSPLVQYITVDELNSTIIRTGLDTFNFSDIITRIQEMPSSPEEDKEDKEDKKDDKPLQFSIGNINLTNSSITLDDKFRHKVDKVTDLNFALPLISNFQNDVDVPITPDLRFNFNGEPFAINAESVPFTPGKKTGVNFTVTGLSLENAASFNPIPLNVKVTKGTMDCAFNLDFEKKQGEENAYLRLKGTVKMKDVGLEDEIGKAYQIIGVKEIDANLKEFAFFRQNLDIGEIQLHNPSVVVIRDSDSLNLVQLLTHIVKEQKAQVKQNAKEAKEKSALPADEKKTPNDWSWNIDKVSVRNGTINFTDTSNNFKRSATNVNVTLSPINGKDGTRTSIDASVGAIGGHIQANGGMVITPFSMDLNLQSSGLSIADLTPYISQYSGAHVTQGTFSNKGELKLNLGRSAVLLVDC